MGEGMLPTTQQVSGEGLQVLSKVGRRGREGEEEILRDRERDEGDKGAQEVQEEVEEGQADITLVGEATRAGAALKGPQPSDAGTSGKGWKV